MAKRSLYVAAVSLLVAAYQLCAPITVAAAVQDHVEPWVAASGDAICLASLIPAQCSDTGISCAYP